MPPDPTGITFPSGRVPLAPPKFARSRSRPSEVERDSENTENVAFQQMPSSPVLPAASPEEGTSIVADYFSPPIKTTSAPLPLTTDAALGLCHDDSGPSIPLTSILPSSSFTESSASVARTTLTSVYSLSPSLSHAHHSSRLSQNEYQGDFSPRGRYNTPPRQHQRQQNSRPDASNHFFQQRAAGSYEDPRSSQMPDAFNVRPQFLPTDRFGAPTGLEYGFQGAFVGTSIARDALLTYAHRLYNNPANPAPHGLTSFPHQSQPNEGTPSPPYYQQLVPLLESIRSQHPHHLPTLLLLSCVHFSAGDYDACLRVCSEILDIDPKYVEAMSNIGMVYKARGANRDAETMWLKAIRLRPTYWDAIDNLLHILCEPIKLQDGISIEPRYHDALEVLEYVLKILIGSDGLLLVFVPPAHLHRLQNLLFTSGNLRSVVSQDPRAGLHDHTRALELLLRPSGSLEYGDPLCFRDMVVASAVIGMLGSPSTKSSSLGAIADVLNIDPARFTRRVLECGIDWLGLVHQAGQKLVDILFHEGKGVLPMVLLTPEMALRLPGTLFGSFAGTFPALCVRASYENHWHLAPGTSNSAANKVTSTILLTLAKLLQSKNSNHIQYLLGSDQKLPRSLSLTLMLYYLALSLNPTPSTYNNIGIILYTVKNTSNAINAQGQRETISGILLSQLYYKKGLEMQPTHPHLLTNYGSLLQDQGRPLEAISMYKKALVAKPDFEVALANLANVVKDAGHVMESIQYYQRALAVSPDFPDVICGLANALSSICDWRGNRGSTGNEPIVNEHLNLSFRASKDDLTPHGWMGKIEVMTKQQLDEGYKHGIGAVRMAGSIDDWFALVESAHGSEMKQKQYRRWKITLERFYTNFDRREKAVNEAGFIIRFVEYMNRIIQKRWYQDAYLKRSSHTSKSPQFSGSYRRIRLPGMLEPPITPSVLPFHTFTYVLDVRTLRLVACRNALRISYNALMAPWLPEVVYQPPPPPAGKLNIGYVSSDFSNHPLAHLMLSVFGMHDSQHFNVFLYATTSSDNSYYRQRIEDDSQHFRDVSKSATQTIVEQILQDQIHILVNLGGYTKGARNDIFAARPCTVQVSMVGYAGTFGASWCDYLLGDKYACPKEAFGPYHTAMRKSTGQEVSRLQDHFVELQLETDMPNDDADPESTSLEWSFTEKFLHMPHSYFVTDHRQAFQEDHFDPTAPLETIWLQEERLRLRLRREIFPDLADDIVIFACFSQLYKICPSAFFVWLKILQRVPGSVLWLLRFPSAGEEHLMRVAMIWAGEEVASRVQFTDIARKDVHVRRCRVADLFLDTFQCNAHTIAADVLWTGTPILTWPKEQLKMCTRVASSIAYATGFGDSMVVRDKHAYQERAVALAQSISYQLEPNPEGGFDRRGSGELIELRRSIFLNRNRMPLFDTARWTRNLEKGYNEIWDRWSASCKPPWCEADDGGCVSIVDQDPFFSS